MSRVIATTVVALVMAASGAGAQKVRDPFGVWQHPENGSQIELYPCEGALCARSLATRDGQEKDTRNADPALRHRPIARLVIIDGARRTGPATWAGHLYNRIDGNTYAARLTLEAGNRLVITGCTLIVVCRSVTWHRVAKSAH
jgi:uncharacterized protein (DUF2147 family)